MDLERALREVGGLLEARGFRFALAGALALHAHGRSRATQDLDLVVDAGGQEQLVTFLEAAGYETLYRSPGYSNHLHPDPARGRLDFIYVASATADQLFSGCSETRLGGRRVLVPRPEHLAAMKVRAIRNDPGRMLQDLADIQYLLGLPGVDVDEVRGYFERAGLGARFDELTKG